MGSLRWTAEGTEEEEEEKDEGRGPPPAPALVDVKRLMKLKAEQQERLKKLRVRVDRLASQEQRVWKDVARTQEKSLQAQEKQMQRQEQHGELARLERQISAQEQALRNRVRDQRLYTLETRDVPRLRKLEENKALSDQVRNDSKRLNASVQLSREQQVQNKAAHVDARRQQCRQQKLKRELDRTRKERVQQEANAERYAELQEEIQNAELAIAVVERQEINAVQRLQNSQSVRAEIVSQLQDIGTSKPMGPCSPGPLAENNGYPNVEPPPTQHSASVRGGLASPRPADGSLRGGVTSTSAAGGLVTSSRSKPLMRHGSRSGLSSSSVGHSSDLGQIN